MTKLTFDKTSTSAISSTNFKTMEHPNFNLYPTKVYSYGIPLKCNNNSVINGRVNVFNRFRFGNDVINLINN